MASARLQRRSFLVQKLDKNAVFVHIHADADAER
jgi:hypothetical protein